MSNEWEWNGAPHRREGSRDKGSRGRSYYSDGVFTYPLIYKYRTLTERHAVGHNDAERMAAVEAAIAPTGPSPYALTEHEPPPCAMGACQNCGRTLVSVFGHKDRKVTGTCGACAKARQ